MTLRNLGTNVNALNNVFAGHDTPPRAYGGQPPISYVTLTSASQDETATGSAATVVGDSTIFETGFQSWKVASSGSANPELRITPTDVPITFPAASAVCARVYVPDVAAISLLTVDIYGDAPLTFADRWSRNTGAIQAVALKAGWQTVRFPAHQGLRTAGKWGNVYQLRLTGTNAAAAALSTFYVDRVWVECPRKATFLFINDGPYHDFYVNGYPGLKARGLPVTFAVDPSLLGTTVNSGGIDMPRMTKDELDIVAAENGNSISTHAWGDVVNSGMTAAQIRADVMRTTKWLQSNYPNNLGWIWRAAWWNEDAPQHDAAIPYYMGQSTYKSDSGPTSWPPPDLNNIPRYSIYQTRTQANIDSLFEQLKNCREHVSMFTHRVSATPGPFDCDLTMWNYILSNIDTGIAEGWLEGVTFEQLLVRAGARFRQALGGGQVVEYYNEDGDLSVRTLA